MSFRKILAIIALAAFTVTSKAQESSKSFGGWAFTEIYHSFDKPKFYLGGYIECDNYYFRELDCVYARISFGYQPLKWLKFGVNYVPQYEPSGWSNMIEADITGTLQLKDLKLSLRERYRYNFTAGNNELRSKPKIAYSIPDSRFTPYVAAEVFTWGLKWMKTRYYFACQYDILDYMQLEVYYLLYQYSDKSPLHAIGFGLNFNI